MKIRFWGKNYFFEDNGDKNSNDIDNSNNDDKGIIVWYNLV